MPEATAQSGPHANHLICEKSPYLLMHAHNPVEWYPWGEEAFARARRENKPIFLSVGYSTCHWCHVMEQESFVDPGTAQIMNRFFISIKVDREERPDVDRIYMTFVQATTGAGGWPMSVFLTPELKPFFGGTYWPPEDRYGRPGFRAVLERVAEAWERDREKILASADEATNYLGEISSSGRGPSSQERFPAESLMDEAFRRFDRAFDRVHGGFGGAPKFPRPVVFNFLLRYFARRRDERASEIVLATLRAMAAGGVRDHLGGGFHRYSVDAAWHVPHFEKMLYDQAQLALSYLEAFQISRDHFYAEAARSILDYALRDLRDPAGGFYAAEDADSLVAGEEGRRGEGAFYVWTADEIERVLGREAAAVLNFYYGVGASGNVQDDPQGEFIGKNILHAVHSPAEAAEMFRLSEEEIARRLADARGKLFAARSARPRPNLDDKILTAWNGLAISALARASEVLGDPRYVEAATAAAAFVKSRLTSPETRILLRRYREGEGAIEGFLEDHAFLIQGLLDLYEASFDVAHLAWAIELQEKQDELFSDTASGGYFSTSGRDDSVILRLRDDYDGAEPAGNSVAAMNLLRLAEMTGRTAWLEKAEAIFSLYSSRLQAHPEAMPQMLAALEFAFTGGKQIVIAGSPRADDTRALLQVVRENFIPNRVLLLADGARSQEHLAEFSPRVAGFAPVAGHAAAYVCQDFVCKLPVTNPRDLFAQLART